MGCFLDSRIDCFIDDDDDLITSITINGINGPLDLLIDGLIGLTDSLIHWWIDDWSMRWLSHGWIWIIDVWWWSWLARWCCWWWWWWWWSPWARPWSPWTMVQKWLRLHLYWLHLLRPLRLSALASRLIGLILIVIWRPCLQLVCNLFVKVSLPFLLTLIILNLSII